MTMSGFIFRSMSQVMRSWDLGSSSVAVGQIDRLFMKRDFVKLHLMLSLSQFGSTWSAARRWHLRLPRVSLSK